MSSGARFHPPQVTMPQELAWVLARALGPPGRRLDPGDVAAAESLADRLLLLHRISARTPRSLLGAELGKSGALRVTDALQVERAVQIRHQATRRVVAETAASMQTPTVFLKGSALCMLGVGEAASRVNTDVDVLVSADRANEMQRAMMQERGFNATTGHDKAADPLHLAPLIHPRFTPLEIHRYMPGVRLRSGARVASVEELLADDLLSTPRGMPYPAMVPRHDVLLASLTVHAVAQHPQHLCHFFRYLCDVQDLLAAAGDRRQQLLERASSWIRWLVGPDELSSLVAIVDGLEAGANPTDLIAEEGPGAQDLRHFTGLLVDPSYRRSLQLRAMFRGFRASDLGQTEWRRFHLFRSRETLNSRLGREMSMIQWLGWNLWRPVRLTGTALKLAAAAVRHSADQ